MLIWTKYLLAIPLLISVGSCKEQLKVNGSETADKHAAITLEEYIYPIGQGLTPQCHAPTIDVSNGTLVASWFGGTEEKNNDVGIWVSRKIEDKWTTPVEVANGVEEDGIRYPCWNPVLFKPENKPLILFYKVGPDPLYWWGMYKTSEDDGLSWSAPSRLADSILGPIKNRPVTLSNGDILSPSSTESETEGHKIHLERSVDFGKTWTKTAPLNDGKTFKAIQPAILDHGKDTIQLLSRTYQGTIGQNWSYDGGLSWSEMTATDLPNPDSGIDALTLKDGRHVLIYNPTTIESEDRVPLSVGLSQDGKTWKRVLDLEPLTATTDKKGEEYSYPTLIQNPDGMIHIVYTWNRKTVKHVVLDPEKL
ncbi:Predicted neuraminidase (sialidase) [Arenibacter palladensis]|uniref:Predicted neuraminidase (Sialidase) n=1 Tax=Arenibacter palladensis TaxID=237373 RepID=A0A1M4UG18_9FLAO|nr:sialidase family protein [Arenibacter palladensis]SHE55568.1 Predicted neuraminidase (sialidase) [Arenibacter palladensis]